MSIFTSDLLFAFLLICSLLIVYFFVGYPIARFFSGAATIRQVVLIAPALGWMLVTLVAGWSVTLGISPVIPLCVLTLTGVIWWFAPRRWIKSPRFERPTSVRLISPNSWRHFGLLVLLAVFAVCIYFSLFQNPSGSLTFVGSVGPDALGYAMAGQSVARGQYSPELAELLESAFPGLPESLALSPLTGSVYSLSSFSSQAALEFITGAGRVGWAGLQGSLLSALGARSLWLIQFSLSTSGLLLLTPIFLLVRKGRSAIPRPTILFAVFMVSGPFLLYSWAQGGSGQVFALPAFILFVTAFVGLVPKPMIAPTIALSTAVMTSTYSDALSLAVIVCVVLTTLTATRLVAISVHVRQVLLGLVLGIFLYLPGSLRLPLGLITRSVDAAQAGWQVPTDFSALRIIGLQGPLTTSSQILGLTPIEQIPRTLLFLVLPTCLLLVIFIFMRLQLRTPLSAGAGLFLSSWLTIALVFYLTQLRQGNTNYQLMKTVSSILPLLVIGLLSRWTQPRKMHQSWPSRKLSRRLQFPRLTWLVTVAVSVVLLATSFQWTRDFRDTAAFQSESSLEASGSQQATAAMDDFAFVVDGDSSAASNWRSLSLGTIANFRWLNRAGVSKLSSADLDGELAIATTDDSLARYPGSFELERISDSSAGDSPLTWLPLGTSAKRLKGKSSIEVCQYAGVLWAANGYPTISGCDVHEAVAGGVFLGQLRNGQKIEKGRCPTTTEHWRALITLTTSFATGGEAILLDTGEVPGALMISMNATGEIRLQQSQVVNGNWLIGYRDSAPLTMISLETNGSQIRSVVNMRETVIDLPRLITCAHLTIGRNVNSTWQPYALRATSFDAN